MTVRAREAVSAPNEPVVAGLKQTTSQRPTDLRLRSMPMVARSARLCGASAPAVSGPKDGDLFSNTATSYTLGISDGLPGLAGASGSRSAGGSITRFCRAAAMETHSPVSGSWRMEAVAGRGAGSRRSGARSGASVVSA